jgi:pyruvate/2-oxoglutarate dehydrogenase complex dihydrolipoamide acyltransferase (E2) component
VAVEEVTMPKYGMTMQEGTISGWEVAAGDHVEEGQPLAGVSTEKVDEDIEAPVSGTVTEILVEQGETVEVGTVLCRIETG